MNNLAFTAYWIFFLLPVYLIRFDFFGKGTLNFLDVFLIIFLALFAVFLIKEKRRKAFKLFLRKNKTFLILLSLIFIGFSLSYLTNLNLNNWENGLGELKSFLILPVLFAIAITFLIQEKKISGLKIGRSYFLSSSLLALGGILYFVLGNTTYDNRLVFLFDSPNHLAMYLVPGIIMGGWLLKNTKRTAFRKLSNLSLCFLLISQIISLLLTRSLGGILGLGVALIFLFPFSKNRLRIKKVGFFSLVAVSALFLMFIFTSQFLTKKINYSPFANHSSFDSRLVIYQVGAKITAGHWLLGIGPGNFQEVYLEHQKFFPPYPQWAVPHPHNLLLAFWLTGGFLGFSGFCLLFWKLRKSIFKRQKSWGLIAVSLMAYFLIHGLIDTPFWKNDLAIIFWLAVALNSMDLQNKKKLLKK